MLTESRVAVPEDVFLRVDVLVSVRLNHLYSECVTSSDELVELSEQ